MCYIHAYTQRIQTDGFNFRSVTYEHSSIVRKTKTGINFLFIFLYYRFSFCCFASNRTDYSITSMARMARSNSILSPKEILPITKENKYFGILREIFLFYHENVFCVYSLESPH